MNSLFHHNQNVAKQISATRESLKHFLTNSFSMLSLTYLSKFYNKKNDLKGQFRNTVNATILLTAKFN